MKNINFEISGLKYLALDDQITESNEDNEDTGAIEYHTKEDIAMQLSYVSLYNVQFSRIKN